MKFWGVRRIDTAGNKSLVSTSDHLHKTEQIPVFYPTRDKAEALAKLDDQIFGGEKR